MITRGILGVKLQKTQKKLKSQKTKISKNIEKFFGVFKKIRFNKRKLKMSFRKRKTQVLKFLKPGFRKIGGSFKNLSFKIYLKISKLKIKNLNPKRVFTNKIILRKVFAALTIIAVIVTAYFQNTPYASAGTNYWDALGWSGGVFNQTRNFTEIFSWAKLK